MSSIIVLRVGPRRATSLAYSLEDPKCRRSEQGERAKHKGPKSFYPTEA